MHLPALHMPDDPPAVQRVVEDAFFVLHLPPLQKPTWHPSELSGQVRSLVQSTHCELEHDCKNVHLLGHCPPQPSSPHALPVHCGVHLHAPAEHVPGLPPLAEHAVPVSAFCATHVLDVPHIPTLQPCVMALQSLLLVQATHCPAPTQCAPFGQALLV